MENVLQMKRKTLQLNKTYFYGILSFKLNHNKLLLLLLCFHDKFIYKVTVTCDLLTFCPLLIWTTNFCNSRNQASDLLWSSWPLNMEPNPEESLKKQKKWNDHFLGGWTFYQTTGEHFSNLTKCKVGKNKGKKVLSHTDSNVHQDLLRSHAATWQYSKTL